MTPCETIKAYHTLGTAIKWCNILMKDDKINQDIFFKGICSYILEVFEVIERDYADLGIERNADYKP